MSPTLTAKSKNCLIQKRTNYDLSQRRHIGPAKAKEGIGVGPSPKIGPVMDAVQSLRKTLSRNSTTKVLSKI